MYRSLLVPLDGSTFGEHALPWALSIARRNQATVQLAYVHVPLLYVDSASAFEATVDVKTQEEERSYLDRVVKRLASVARVPVKPAFLTGPIVDVLHEHAQASDVDLIVMTTHGRGPLSRLWLGSVADELVRRSAKPLLLVRPEEGLPNLTKDRLLRHMLIPLDGSPLAEQIIDPGLALGTPSEADYTLLRVVKPMMPVPTDAMAGAESTEMLLKQIAAMHEQVKKEARTYLEAVAQRLRSQSQRVQTQVVSGAQPAATILDEANARASDVIALETHGRRGMARLLLGSVADKVVRGSHVPVLVHRPTGK